MKWLYQPLPECRSRYSPRFALWPTVVRDAEGEDHWVWLQVYWIYYYHGIFGWRKTAWKFLSLDECHKFDGF